MHQKLTFDADLIRRYDTSGPRYTSYPTAVQFTDDFDIDAYRACVEETRGSGQPLSLYFHIPFCNTVCFYCACNKVVTKDRSKAAPYLERVYRELELQSALFEDERLVDQLHWGGGTPTFLSNDEIRALMAATRRNFRLRDDDLGEYSIEIDPREADAATIALLRSEGFNRLSLGVQDFHPKVQKAVNRIQSEAETRAVIDAARSEGFKSVSLDLIYGLPFQSVASFTETLQTILDIRPDRLSVFNYAHLPERFKPQRRINEEELPSAAEKLDILQHVIEVLGQAGYVYIGMDHFALPDDELTLAQREGSLYRNFQGYSTHADCDLIAVGVSAIGKVGDCYAQNVRDLESYYASLDDGRLPMLRGIRLNADDKLRRHVINELICHFELDMRAIDTEHGIRFEDYFASELERLASMQEDGLLQLSEGRIEVLPAGRLLIRNVCMVFDRYLGGSETPQFSKVI